MKEKLLWSAVAVLGVLLINSHAQTPPVQNPTTTTGRYQLYTVPDTRFEHPHVYRIDMQTGDTWVLRDGHSQLGATPSSRFEYWDKADEQLVFHNVDAEIQNAPHR